MAYNKFYTEKESVSVKKGDRLSHKISINVPNYHANKGVDLSLDL